MAHRDDSPPSLGEFRSEAPELLDAIYQRMVAKSPAARYGCMREVIENLDLLTKPAAAGQPAWDPARSTVLLSEPSRFQAAIIQEYLQQIGIRDVYAFRSGQELIGALAELPAHVVLTSMQLPDMTGIELAQRIRHDLSWMRVAIVLMTSSEVGNENMAAVERLVISQLLIKPFDQSQLAAALENASAVQGAPVRMAGLECLRVLLVDDSSMWRQRLQRVLEALGFVHFVAANDGIEAVACLQAEQFDLILTDYHMPNMSGKELVAHIRQSSRHADVPVVVVTSEYDPLKLAEVHQLGASAICHKSSDPQLLCDIMMRLLH
jgi:two-component system chemotaxis response regulator CheY